MVPRAEIFTDYSGVGDRAAVRRSLRLRTPAYNSEHVTMAKVLNISEAGVLIETVLDLQIDETLQVDIPEASGTIARVVWRKGLLAGCKFIDALPTSAVSAAQLMSPIEATDESLHVAAGGDAPVERSYGASFERSAETAVVMFTSIIALLAVLIFVAAILDFTVTHELATHAAGLDQ